MNSFEKGLLEHINSYRKKYGLPPLAFDRKLHELAGKHSRHMERKNSLSHDGFQERFRSSGKTYCIENVGWNYPSAEGQFKGWKKSEGHNRNMLDKKIRSAGIAKSGAFVTFFGCD
jgi:uncharacterized protein YkwD